MVVFEFPTTGCHGCGANASVDLDANHYHVMKKFSSSRRTIRSPVFLFEGTLLTRVDRPNARLSLESKKETSHMSYARDILEE